MINLVVLRSEYNRGEKGQKFKTVAADAMAPCVARTSAAMIIHDSMDCAG